MHRIFSSTTAATGRQLKQSVNVFHSLMLYRLDLCCVVCCVVVGGGGVRRMGVFLGWVGGWVTAVWRVLVIGREEAAGAVVGLSNKTHSSSSYAPLALVVEAVDPVDGRALVVPCCCRQHGGGKAKKEEEKEEVEGSQSVGRIGLSVVGHSIPLFPLSGHHLNT